MGATEYGVYTYIFAWVGLLTILAIFGMQSVLIREISAYNEREEWGLIHGILRWTARRATLISTGIMLIAGIGAWLGHDYLNPNIFPALWIALISLPFLTLFILISTSMQGLKRVLLAEVPGLLIRSPLFILFIVLFYLFVPQDLSALWTILLSSLAIMGALIFGVWLLYKNLPREVLSSIPQYQQRAWITSALPLLLTAGLFEINNRTPILMLGSMTKVEDVAIFNIANLIAGLVTFILISVNTVLGPVISGLYATGDMRRLQRVVTISARGMLVAGGVMSLSLILLRHWLLQFFDSEFQNAEPIISILILGQMINVAAGSAGLLLIITGHEKDAIKGVGISTVLLIALNAILIPIWGVVGAAFATVASMILWNLILIIMLYKRTGINSTALGWMSRWSH
jgi:O-antigen/teichoic acid export membrane protein